MKIQVNKKIVDKLIRRVMHMIASLILILVVAACENKDSLYYSLYYDIPNEKWLKGEICEFKILSDSLQGKLLNGIYDVVIGIRHTEDYQYKDLWVEMTEIDNDTIESTDTIHISLMDTLGRWKGRGYHGLYQYVDTLKRNVKLNNKYVINIGHVMNVDTLKHISNIGIIILNQHK